MACPWGQTGLTASAATSAVISEAMKVKKIKLEILSSYQSGGKYHGANSENGDLSSSVGEFLTLFLTVEMGLTDLVQAGKMCGLSFQYIPPL